MAEEEEENEPESSLSAAAAAMARAAGATPRRGGGPQGSRAEPLLDIDALLARYPVDERARDYLESSPPEVVERILREFQPPREGESDYSGLLTSYVKRSRQDYNSGTGGPSRGRGPPQDHWRQEESEKFLQELVERYPVDDIAKECFRNASPEVQERMLYEFRPPREGESDYSALFMSFLKKLRTSSAPPPAWAPMWAPEVARAPPLRAAGWGAGPPRGSIARSRHDAWQETVDATPTLTDFLAQYPVDERALEYFSMQTPELQGKVLREFRAKIEGEADYSSLFMAFVKRCRNDLGYSQPPPLQPMSAFYGGYGGCGGYGGYGGYGGRRSSTADWGLHGGHYAADFAWGGDSWEGQPGEAISLEDFRKQFPMDDRAFEYLSVSSIEVQDHVLRTFMPPREDDVDFSAPVTAYVKHSRKLLGSGPGSRDGISGARQVTDSGSTNGGSARLPADIKDMLDTFLERYPCDERATDYLNMCTPAVIERVVQEFTPKQEGDADYSAIVTSFTKRIRGQTSQDHFAGAPPEKRQRTWF